MKNMSGIQYIATLEFFDVLQDGTLIGTVHLVSGGWCFYAAPRRDGLRNMPGYRERRFPTSVGTSRDAAVYAALRQAEDLHPEGD